MPRVRTSYAVFTQVGSFSSLPCSSIVFVDYCVLLVGKLFDVHVLLRFCVFHDEFISIHSFYEMTYESRLW